MKRLSPFITVVICLHLLIIAALLIMRFFPLEEMFGSQGGALVQLSAAPVPTGEDIDDWKAEQKQVQKDLLDMNGPGP